MKLLQSINLSILALTMVLLLFTNSCRLIQRDPNGTDPSLPKGTISTGEYEIVWIDPQMILADSTCTLIRASRIDSIPSETGIPKSDSRPSVEFQIRNDNCLVSATINDAKGRVVQSLLFRQLNLGHYRLSPDQNAIKKLWGRPGSLVVNVCGNILRRPINDRP